MRVVGIDSSTVSTAISYFVDGEYKSYTLHQPDKKLYKTKWDRLDPMIKEIYEQLDTFQPEVVFQEDAWSGKDPDTMKCLSNCLGAVRGWCLQHNVEYVKIMPSSWRAKLGLNGGKLKRDELKILTKEYVESKYNISIPIDDVSDCIAICLAGHIIKGLPHT